MVLFPPRVFIHSWIIYSLKQILEGGVNFSLTCLNMQLSVVQVSGVCSVPLRNSDCVSGCEGFGGKKRIRQAAISLPFSNANLLHICVQLKRFSAGASLLSHAGLLSLPDGIFSPFLVCLNCLHNSSSDSSQRNPSYCGFVTLM